MTGVTALAALLASMRPEIRPGEYVFVSLPSVPDAECEATIREQEGVTCIVRRRVADERGWPYDFVAGWITLQVHSALEAVGLTAAVTQALTHRGISCNVVAGYYHDHLLVPIDRREDAIRVLEALSASA